jgi:Skp family chaperone for outer membrane proteins
MAVTAGTKIAVVNLETLVKNHPSHESNRALVKTTAEDYRKKMEAKQEQLKKLVEEGKKLQSDWQNPILSAAGKSELQKKMETIQQKLFAGQQEMRADDQHYQNELADLQQRLFKIEKTEVEKQIREYAKAEGFDLVVDAAACGFAAPKLDVTDAILKKMGVDPKKNK